MVSFLKSKRFLLYHLIIAGVISALLTFEDLLEDEFSGAGGRQRLLVELVQEIPVFFTVTLLISAVA